MTAVNDPTSVRLRMEESGNRRTLLDGGWWPHSTDPVAELPGLILAIDARRGPVTRVILGAAGWDSRPRRVRVAGRSVRVGFFDSQSASLLTALTDQEERVDLLVVAPDTQPGTAEAAMLLAATTSNLVHAQHILAAVLTAAEATAAEPKAAVATAP